MCSKRNHHYASGGLVVDSSQRARAVSITVGNLTLDGSQQPASLVRRQTETVSNAAVYTSNFTPQSSLTASGSTKGLWKFNGQTTNDFSTNGNHGTLQGGATFASDVLGGGGGGGTEILWLVTDHLGTPRMIADQSRSLAGIRRHDYLPFGEELFAGTGNRSTAQGYASGDGTRQKFT